MTESAKAGAWTSTWTRTHYAHNGTVTDRLRHAGRLGR